MTINEINVALFASAIALLAVTFLIGRFNGTKAQRYGGEHHRGFKKDKN